MLVLGVVPVIETLGQIAAIVICLFAFIFILLAVVLNLVLAFGTSWLNEKISFIKMLRPSVESMNKATVAVSSGEKLPEDESILVRTVSAVPHQMHSIDKKVDETTQRVADGVIEFHARTVQVKTVLKALFVPGLLERERIEAEKRNDKQGLEFNSPGYRMLMKEEVAKEAPVLPAVPSTTPAVTPVAVPASRLKDAATR